MFWILFTFSVTCTTPTLISSLHVDSRCFHSFRPGEGFLYVSYNCQPCNYRIWTKPLGPRVGLLVCVYICIYTHTHTHTDIVDAPGPLSGLWSVSQSSQWQKWLLAGQRPEAECVTWRWMHYSLHHSQEPHLYFHDIDRWNIYFGMAQHIAGRAEKKIERERESHQQHCLFGVFWFCYRLVISAAAAAAGCCHRDTQRHTFRHKTQSHSSCGITETQTGACASTHTNTHCNTFQAWCHSVAHMLPWPLCLWVREQWWVTTFLASRRVCFPKTVSSIL